MSNLKLKTVNELNELLRTVACSRASKKVRDRITKEIEDELFSRKYDFRVAVGEYKIEEFN